MTEKYIPRFSQKKTLRIPSIRLDEKILENLFEIVDKEYKKMEAKDVHGRLTIGFREKNGDEYTFDDVKSSLEKINLKSIKRIDLWFYEGKDKDVNLTIDTNIYHNSSGYTVTGTDPDWVITIKEHIAEVFKNDKTRNNFFHSQVSWPFWIFVGFLLGLLYQYYFPNEFWARLTMILIFPLSFGFYLRWLFPMVETEHMIQTKIRNWVVLGLSGIPFALLGNYIWSFFQH
jgi:hypothetical protein